jgi:hypothetical protein
MPKVSTTSARPKADAKGVEHAERQHEAHPQQPGAAGGFGEGVEVLEVHQRHHPGQDGFGGAGEHMHDQVGRQGAGDGEEAAHAAVDVVVHRAGGRQDRRRFGEGGRLREHHHCRNQHGHGEGAAADAEAHGGGEDHRAGHDQADGAGQRGGKPTLPRLRCSVSLLLTWGGPWLDEG